MNPSPMTGTHRSEARDLPTTTTTTHTGHAAISNTSGFEIPFLLLSRLPTLTSRAHQSEISQTAPRLRSSEKRARLGRLVSMARLDKTRRKPLEQNPLPSYTELL